MSAKVVIATGIDKEAEEIRDFLNNNGISNEEIVSVQTLHGVELAWPVAASTIRAFFISASVEGAIALVRQLREKGRALPLSQRVLLVAYADSGYNSLEDVCDYSYGGSRFQPQTLSYVLRRRCK
ncbi:TPA: hypothetical protein DD449_00535 [Candidatus Berkelbacteria bacterium]|uniref:Uncharacterized protein n=1 Tax=Berkelbacteria bacterium GW2011_GWE1_39_12 TaxID=1618337 RepID=A0A0G4B710_9BACT|nr:MAG: hypothetical protein UT28_C0001G0980 [Berkelbacteria bacterium GW2011_GWE1_39_12]HBO60157.1 hypothetical protein [Candidatus Berkelbacteria bacterium]